MYSFLALLLHLHFVFSGALPFDQRDPSNADGGGVHTTTWEDAVDEKGLCRLNTSLPLDCNVCNCVQGWPPACTMMACPPKYIDSHKPCKAGNRWKEDCNKCICSEEGYAQCTIRDCMSRKRMKRYFGFDIEHGKKSHCTPGTSWKVDCNSCTCSEKGIPECTFKACIKWERIIDKSNLTQEIKDLLDEEGKCKNFMLMRKFDCNTCFCSDDGELYCTLRTCSKKEHREKRATNGAIPAGGKCKPGDRWKLDECNNCVCTHTGFASCTLNECSTPKSRPKRTPGEGAIPAGGKCKPGDRWKLDECNNCVCTHTGFASCTLNECSTPKSRPKRHPASEGKIPPGGKCKAGDRWKLDECNNCVCTHTGFASCTLNECSTSKSRPKRHPAGEGKQNAGGKCKPGDKWDLDECNKCVCTHTGYASCTLNDCAQQTGRPKRSAQPSRISDYMDAERKCKQKGSFNVDCNTCHCSEAGKYPLCTQKGCISAKNVLQRSERDARNENGNSGLECKPGASWKENCNSCFCSEQGIAMCTDIPTCPSPPPAPAKEISKPLIATSSANSTLPTPTPLESTTETLLSTELMDNRTESYTTTEAAELISTTEVH